MGPVKPLANSEPAYEVQGFANENHPQTIARYQSNTKK